MNPNVLTLLGGALGLLVAGWTIAANFDKGNSDRFDALQEEDVYKRQVTHRGDERNR